MNSRALRALDPILGTLGVVIGIPSLLYPFGRDQGLYYYVGREWVLRGSIPYRDVLDHKTPGLYYLHALSVFLFGEQMWGIRVFELFCVVALGVLAGALTARRGEPVRAGVRGAAILAASVVYFGYFDFWNTAQSELWYGTLGVASIWAAVRLKSESRAALASGAFAGAAVIFKPPAIWMVLVAVSLLIGRSRVPGAPLIGRLKAALPPLLRFGLTSALVPAMTFAYFGAKGALPAMFDIVVGANAYYVKHEQGDSPWGGLFIYHWCFFPLVPVLLVVLVVALVRSRRSGDRETFSRYGLAAVVTATGYAAVVMQGKYYLLHWGVMVPAWTMISANAARSWSELLSKRGRAWAFAPTFTAQLVGLWCMAMISCEGPNMWRLGVVHGYRWKIGQESRELFTDHFQWPGLGFHYRTSERAGDWLREHTTPDETITVRGFQPEVYAVARRRHRGRFFWTTFLCNPARAYRREEWLKEDLDAIAAHPPKYVVALTGIHGGPDSAEYFDALGWKTTIVMDEFTIMEHPAQLAKPVAP